MFHAYKYTVKMWSLVSSSIPEFSSIASAYNGWLFNTYMLIIIL